jgi:hypothetical protein
MALVRIIFMACDAVAKRDGFVQAERHRILKTREIQWALSMCMAERSTRPSWSPGSCLARSR